MNKMSYIKGLLIILLISFFIINCEDYLGVDDLYKRRNCYEIRKEIIKKYKIYNDYYKKHETGGPNPNEKNYYLKKAKIQAYMDKYRKDYDDIIRKGLENDCYENLK